MIRNSTIAATHRTYRKLLAELVGTGCHDCSYRQHDCRPLWRDRLCVRGRWFVQPIHPWFNPAH